MNNKNTSPTIVFAKEELLEKKRITSFLRTNNIEFTPKKNYYGDYEATIKVRSQTPTKRGEEIIKVLQDKESRNKIDFMFNLLAATTDPSSEQKNNFTEQSPEKGSLASLANIGEDQKVHSPEKENINIEEQPLSAHFGSEKEAPTSLDMSLTESKRGNESKLKGRSSPEKSTSCRITGNSNSPGKKIRTQGRSPTKTELSTRVSETTTQRSQAKCSSVKDVSYARTYSSESKLYKKEVKLEEEDENQRVLAIANSLGRLHIEEAPTVSPFKIVTETISSIKEQKEEVNMTPSYSCIETPTLGQLVCGRESRSNLMAGVLENTPIKESLKREDQEGSNNPTSNQEVEPRHSHSKNSSVSSLFTLCGNEIPKEEALIDSPNPQQTAKEDIMPTNARENPLEVEGSESLLTSKGGDSSSRFKQWTDLILQDDFLKQLLLKIQENTGKSEAESLVMLITMMQQASENENNNNATESSSRLESTPSEIAPPNSETKKKEQLNSNSTPSRKGPSKKEVKPYKPSISTSQSAVKGSNTTLLNKSATKKTPMSSEKMKKQNEKPKEQSLSTKKDQGVASSKSLQVPLNSVTNVKVDSKNEINDTGRFPQSLSCQVFQNALNESEVVKKTLHLEDVDDPSNLSLCDDKFEEANGIYHGEMYDDISSIQYQDKSLDNTRGLFDTIPGFTVSIDDRDKHKVLGDFSSFDGRKENEVEEIEEDEVDVDKEYTLTEEEIYRNNSEVMKNINNLVHKSAYSSSATKHNSMSKMSLKSDHMTNRLNTSKILPSQNLTTEFTSTKTSASSMLEGEKGKAERRRHTREIYNELSRRSFQGSIVHVSEKQEKLGTKETQDTQARYEGLTTEGMTKYFKLLLAKKSFQTIEPYRKKPKGEASLLLY